MCFSTLSAGAIFDRETLFGPDAQVETIPQTPVQPDKPYLSGLGGISLEEAAAQAGVAGAGLIDQTSTTTNVAEGILLSPVAGSEKISAAGYDAASKTMVLKMKATGEVKSFLDVPETLYTNFIKSTIKDSFFTLAIEGRYTEGSSTSSVKGSEGEKITVTVIH